MALRGRGAVAIWHDIAAEGRDVFYDWHGNEHMAERVGIPGFQRGRRYVAERGDLEYFNLYEADTLAVVTGADYKARVNNPTPWTIDAVKHFRDVNRSICTVAETAGVGGGGLIATWRYDAAGGSEAALWRDVLAPLGTAPGVAGVHLLVADAEASAVGTAESEARGRANAVPTRAILVEGWGDLAPFAELCDTRLSEEVLRAHGARGPIPFGLYRLQLSIDAPA